LAKYRPKNSSQKLFLFALKVQK